MRPVQTDLTQGDVRARLIRYTLPIIATSLLQSLYGVVDMAVVSHILGEAGASAVGTAGQVTRTVMIIAVGLSNGGSIQVSQYFGAGDRAALERVTGTFVSLFFLLGAAASLLFFGASRWIAVLLRAPALEETYAYLAVCGAGFLFVFLYNALAATLRALGNSREPMQCVLTASVLNIGLDLLFLGPLGMGTAGAALATVISQAVSCALAFFFLARRRDVFSFSRKNLRPNGALAGRILRLGAPSALSMSMVGLSWFVVAYLINGYGVLPSAASGIAAKIRDFFHLILASTGVSTMSFIAQNLGARQYERAKTVMYTAMRLSVGIALVTIVFMECAAPFLARLFTADPAVAALTARNLRIEIICELFYAVVLTYQSMMNGAGHTGYAMLNSLSSGIFFRIPLSILFSRLWGLDGIFIACALAPAIPIPLGWLYIRSGRWRGRIDETLK